MFRPPFRFLAPALLAAFLAAGCRTPPPADSGKPAPPAPAPAAKPAPAPAPAPAPSAASPKPAPAPAAKPAPKPQPRPWRVSCKAGSQQATIDGMLVFLGKPAVSNWKNRTVSPSDLDRRLTVSPLLQARSKPLVEGRPLRVCLDPGHGGADNGAQTRDGRTLEKELSLDIALRVAKRLRADGAEVFFTRTDNATTLELSDRPMKARARRADLFVSIHMNANANAAPNGTETYVFPGRGMESTSADSRRASPESRLVYHGNANDWGNVQLGFCIHRRLVAATGLEDRGLRRARFVVLREATMPAALVECAFLSNPEDLAFLRSEAGREKIARGIYEGIFDFAWGNMAPGLPAHEPGPPVAEIVPNGRAPAAQPTPLQPPPPPLEFVQGPRPPAWTPPPEPADGDPARAALRASALRAAGLAAPSTTPEKRR